MNLVYTGTMRRIYKLFLILLCLNACNAARFDSKMVDRPYRLDTGLAQQECLPRESRCVADNQAQRCDELGRWSPPQVCANSQCVGNRCAEMCGAGCMVGALGCDGNQIQRCVESTRGCTEWQPFVECARNQICADGVCSCTAPCQAGEQVCDGDGASRRCEPNGCWGASEPCGRGEVCEGGACRQAGGQCIDQCPEGRVLCVSETQYQLCERQASGCLDYSRGSTCAPGTVCDPVMRCEEPDCQSECTPGTTRCDQGAVQRCETDLRGCAIWAGRTTCDFSQTCQDGQCVAQCSNLCVPGERRCAVGEVVEFCVDNGGCAVWQTQSQCNPGSVCLPGGECGQCVNGQENVRACDSCGQQSQICANGAWSEWSECPAGCVPGTTEACGLCGQRVCQNDCEWSACEGEGVCQPGERMACGDCGQKECSATCDWSSDCIGVETFQECNHCGWQWCNEVGEWYPCARPEQGNFDNNCTMYCLDNGWCDVI